jgi:hypothetical protein
MAPSPLSAAKPNMAIDFPFIVVPTFRRRLGML